MPSVVSSMAPVRINSTVLPVARVGASAGIQGEVHEHSGQLYASLHRISGAIPRVVFTTPFRAAYDLIGLGVLEATVLDVYWTKYGALVPTAGSTHPRLALSTSCKAACHITGISVAQDGLAMAEVECWPLSVAGVAHPMTYTQNNALIALASQPILHTLGPVSLNGTVVPGVQSQTIDLGQRLESLRTDGALYPIVAARTGGRPRISVGHSDPYTVLQTLGLLGLNLSSNLVAYLRQYDGTTGVIDTGATAISLTIASGRASPDEVTSEQGAISTIGFSVEALSATATHPIVVATGATAPALP